MVDARPAATRPPVSVRTLLCHRDLPFAVDSLRTLLACCVDPIRLVVHDDGSLTGTDCARLANELPGSRVLSRREADEIMAARLARHGHARAFRDHSVWGLKLLDIALAEPGDCFYLDGDIRFFRPFGGLFKSEAVAGRSVFLRDTVWTAYSVRPWHLLDRRRLRVVEGINTGLTLMDRALYDLDFVDWFLGQPDWRVIPAWTEPTCWAALAVRARGHAVDPAHITNLYPSARITTGTVGAHFLSAHRDRFRNELNLAPRLDAPLINLSLLPLRTTSALALGWNQLSRKLTNEWTRRRP